MSSYGEIRKSSDDYDKYKDWLDVSDDDDGHIFFLRDSQGYNTVHRKDSYRLSTNPAWPHSATPYVKSCGRGPADRAISMTPSYEDERSASKRRRAHSIQMGMDSKYNQNFAFDQTNLSRSDSVSSVLNYLENNVGISPAEIMDYVLKYCKSKKPPVATSVSCHSPPVLRHCESCTCHLHNQHPQVELQEQQEGEKKDLKNELVQNGVDTTHKNVLHPHLDLVARKEQFAPPFSSSPKDSENEKTLTPKISRGLELKGRCLESDFENCLNEDKISLSAASSSSTLRLHHPTPFDVNVIQVQNPVTKEKEEEQEEEESLVPIVVTVHCPRKPPKNNPNWVYPIGKVVVSTPIGRCLPPRSKRDDNSNVVPSSENNNPETPNPNQPIVVELQGTVRWLD